MSLLEARTHLSFCIDELSKTDRVNVAVSLRLNKIQDLAKDLDLEIKSLLEDLDTEESGHFGYTSKDGEDFENQEVDRMCDDSKVPSDSELLGW